MSALSCPFAVPPRRGQLDSGVYPVLLPHEVVTAHRLGARETIASCLRGVIRQALVPSTDGNRWALAREYVINEGNFRKWLATKPEEFPGLFRQALRTGKLARYGSALNRSLHALLQAKGISEKAAKDASNDLEITNGQSTLKLA
jgi:Tfp pilus assembly pilus retraction ATPase PilT